MNRKRITQVVPFLLPLRVAQRKMFFYAGMRFDGHAYAKTIQDGLFPYKLFSANSGLYNANTGFDMIYQENKVFNLKLASKTLNGLLIKPGETFSFWRAVRYADKHIPYKDGLTVTNDKLVASPGGGLCQMSNLLFWVFLHSPLTIVERHTHKLRGFPTLRKDEPEGVDATVSEGWLDLKVKNETDMTFQIGIAFDDTHIIGSLFTDKESPFVYEIEGKDLSYSRGNGRVYEEISIYRREMAAGTQTILSKRLLYKNLCEIGYRLPYNTPIVERGENVLNKLKIAVLFGGCSTEYDISLQSAYSVITHLDRSKCDPVLLGITPSGEWFHFSGELVKIKENTWCNPSDCVRAIISPSREAHGVLEFGTGEVRTIRLDAAMPVLHGKNGEDGTVQGLLELAGIPIVGCNALCSALCMDKDKAHKIAHAADVRVPHSFILENEADAETAWEQAERIGYPLFVKPVRAGSSFGITKVSNKDELPAAVRLAFEHDGRVIIEENISGFEVGCAVLG